MAKPAFKIRQIKAETPAWRAAFDESYSDCRVKELAAGQPHAYFAAFAGDTLAGHCVIYHEDGRWVMDGLRVKPEFRQMGVAKRLTAARLAYAVKQGAKEVWYSCDDGNLVTICCHKYYGFEKVCPAGHKCSVQTSHWYRLAVTPALFRKFPELRPSRPRSTAARSKPR
jgi:ribosomal protein S18 acetylase RimI-like enzyme